MAAFRSAPRPEVAIAAFCIQDWNASRVGSSNVRKISSSCTASETWARGRVAPSGRVGTSRSPWVSST